MATINVTIDGAIGDVGTLGAVVFIRLQDPVGNHSVTMSMSPLNARKLARELIRNAKLLDPTGDDSA